MFRPVWEGWPLAPGVRRRDRRSVSLRADAAFREWSGPIFTYFAMSPCGRYVKVGRSWNPIVRIREGTGWRETERRLGIGRVVPVRIYPDDIEYECLRFLRRERVAGEWHYVGARCRILIARLDRKYDSPDLREQFASSRHAVRRRSPSRVA